MLRVPGSRRTLLEVKSTGGNVHTLYSPLDALNLARRHPDREVVFFAIGFETTAPLTALSILQAQNAGLTNFSVLCAHVLIPPAIEALLRSPTVKIDALLAPGHVCTVTGAAPYRQIQTAFDLPIVVTGFEPADILHGIYRAVQLLRQRRSEVVIQYSRAVTLEGNVAAQQLIERVFSVTDRDWRGLGIIPGSGLSIRPAYAAYDATSRFAITLAPETSRNSYCARVLQGDIAPTACPIFNQDCTKDHPKGAPMVSSEGACAAYMQYAKSAKIRRVEADGSTTNEKGRRESTLQ
jgi:hydrogenase expression/formation protein HypD